MCFLVMLCGDRMVCSCSTVWFMLARCERIPDWPCTQPSWDAKLGRFFGRGDSGLGITFMGGCSEFPRGYPLSSTIFFCAYLFLRVILEMGAA